MLPASAGGILATKFYVLSVWITIVCSVALLVLGVHFIIKAARRGGFGKFDYEVKENPSNEHW